MPTLQFADAGKGIQSTARNIYTEQREPPVLERAACEAPGNANQK